ncbi:MAG: Ig-like domain-containing protein [Planctomycetota bacterium]|nr:Ig-like domain-containing protein [Planctomycetota bacterium]
MEVTANDGNDGNGGTDVQAVQVTVTDANDVPVVSADQFSVDNNKTLEVALPGVLVNDIDQDGDPLTVVLVAGPTTGLLDLRADGTFTYTPDIAFAGDVTFTNQVFDGAALSGVETVTITVEAVAGFNGSGDDGGGDNDDSDDDESDTRTGLINTLDPADDGDVDDAVSKRRARARSASGRDAAARQSNGLVLSEVEDSEDIADLLTREVTDAAREDKTPVRTAQQAGSFELKVPFGFQTTLLWERLDQIQDELAAEIGGDAYVAGMATVVTAAFATGTVVWLVKGGYFLSWMISSLPAWSWMDPLPILNAGVLADDEEEGKDVWDDVMGSDAAKGAI